MKITTIYAARILGYITMKGNALTTAGEIVENVDISYQYCLKVMNEMKRAGILVSEQGCKGGYRMKKRPEDVSVYEILDLFEYNHSNENDREELKRDPFSRFMKQIYEEAAKNLKRFTIADVYGKENEKMMQEEMAVAE
ncbi:RrF2 family transcriptional regulator [Christensenella tenuis]|uniref:Rrf2 family transcriptional regulator n=1 Tax=Christensenella tenuis TaxID=2763033 RepID=A0ABR7EGY8_9FIRM|nr:Rrf2 family transcriptional regulator [Christensenella tenuis]MBC5649016.1 Rrf2 family transcriptional regulator [Christensenella tenuis]